MSHAGEGTARGLGILFDYGETLVEFSRPREAIAEAAQQIRDVLRASGRGDPAVATIRAIMGCVERQVIEHQQSGSLDEIDVAAVSMRAYDDAGVHLDHDLLDEVLRIEQEAWWHGAHLDADTIPVLDALRQRRIRVGLCSNAPYRVESLHGQLAFLGLESHLDAVTFSAEVGWRKPSPRIFETAIRALGTEAECTVMVGDDEAADIAGAHAAGMRAVLIRRSGNRTTGGAEAVIAALRELPGALRNMGLYSE